MSAADDDRIIPLRQREPPPPTSEDEYFGTNGSHAPPRASVPALWHSDEAWDECDIPQRAWLAKGYLLRGAVSLIVGPGSAGKSSLVKAWIIAACFGIPFGRFQPLQPLRTMSYNVEDDLAEERRRLSASLRGFEKNPRDLAGTLRILGPNTIGTLIERTQDGQIRLTEAMTTLVQHIEDFRPDVLFLDPLVELHTSDENDNTGLRAVVAQLRSLAARFNIAILIVHHTRKGATTPGDPEAARGAGAIVGACRCVFTVCGMAEDEATGFGIPATSRKFYFRLDGAKMNYSVIGDPEWFERQTHTLDNGEDVAAAVPWEPPQDAVTTDTMAAIKEAVSRGFQGGAYTYRKGSARSLANLCHLHGITTETGIKQVASQLKDAGFAEHPVRDASRNAVKGIRSPDGHPKGLEWLDYDAPKPTQK